VPPPPSPRTNWTRLVPPSVLTGHVSFGGGGGVHLQQRAKRRSGLPERCRRRVAPPQPLLTPRVLRQLLARPRARALSARRRRRRCRRQRRARAGGALARAEASRLRKLCVRLYVWGARFRVRGARLRAWNARSSIDSFTAMLSSSSSAPRPPWAAAPALPARATPKTGGCTAAADSASDAPASACSSGSVAARAAELPRRLRAPAGRGVGWSAHRVPGSRGQTVRTRLLVKLTERATAAVIHLTRTRVAPARRRGT
jgi:hypothetical protein